MKGRTLLEERIFERGYHLIAGVDEAGRGSLAGPVVASACILPRNLILEGVDDSKKLSPSQRKQLYHTITKHPEILFGIGIVESHHIDKINILQAALYAMKLAIQNLPRQPDYLLIDGPKLPPTHITAQAVIKGDSLSQSIAAASILAKCTRDTLMVDLHDKWPHYAFDQHKGYGTLRHVQAIRKHGPCPIHRRSFEPVRSLTAQ